MTSIRAAAFSILAGLLLFGSRSAPGAEVRLDTAPSCQEQHVDVAAMPGGGFVAVWQDTALPGVVGHPRIFARLFGPFGIPLGPEFQVNGDSDGVSPAVAANAAGSFLVVWRDTSRGVLMTRLYGPTGSSSLRERELATFAKEDFAVTATGDGGFAVASLDRSAVALARLDATGQPQGSPQPIASYTLPLPDPNLTYADPAIAAYGPSGVVIAWAFEDHLQRTLHAVLVNPGVEPLELDSTPLPFSAGDSVRPQPAVAATASGRILMAWNEQNLVRAQVLGADRQPLGPPFRVGEENWLYLSSPDAAASGSGDFLVAWHAVSLFPSSGNLNPGFIQRIGADGSPVRPAFQGWSASTLAEPAIAAGSGERTVVAWPTAGKPEGPNVCSSDGLYARSLDLSPGVLRLQNERFEARIHWTDHAGHSGEGQAVPYTGDSGYFWFFGEHNLEVMVKVLDGRAFNGSFWVFYGALSDVSYTLTVTDTATGQTRTYDNPAGRLASHADTFAFPTAAAGSAPAVAAGRAETAWVESSAIAAAAPVSDDDGPCIERSPPVPGLCLGHRFEVEVTWQIPGQAGVGEGVRLTDDSGYLWFFGRNNAELVVKVLDGRAVNGHFWVFYGALSNVDYTILVRDTATGVERTYHNPAGQLASVADTAAF